MATFPDIKNPHPNNFSQRPMKAQIRSTFENGAIQSRAKFTRMSWLFTFGWPSSWALTNAEYLLLVNSFNDNVGGKMDYTHWISGTIYEVQYMDNELPEAVPINGTHWALTGLNLYGIEVV